MHYNLYFIMCRFCIPVYYKKNILYINLTLKTKTNTNQTGNLSSQWWIAAI
jgi:hypothetical protein